MPNWKFSRFLLPYVYLIEAVALGRFVYVAVKFWNKPEVQQRAQSHSNELLFAFGYFGAVLCVTIFFTALFMIANKFALNWSDKVEKEYEKKYCENTTAETTEQSEHRDQE